MRKFRILSIDGGGIKGAFPASFLAQVEQNIQGSIWEYFDLIAGTSTGGIIALALGLGIPAADVLGFYSKHGPIIFPQGFARKTALGVKHFFWAKYDSHPLRVALEATLGTALMGDAKTRLMIPSQNLETGEVHVYKTRHAERLMLDYKEQMVDVAMATSAAPTYFPTHRSAHGLPLVDGGMWANNPSGFAVVEALSVLNIPAESIHLLSLGCTEAPLQVNWARFIPMGELYWATKAADVFMAGQSSASMGSAFLLSGRDEARIKRVSPYVSSGHFALDGSKAIHTLFGLGQSEARKALPELLVKFFNEKAEPFVPVPFSH